jgi:hypothetical protein
MLRFKIFVNSFLKREIFKISMNELDCMCTMRENCYICDYIWFTYRVIKRRD